MSVAEQKTLRSQILDILRGSGKPLSVPEIEVKLKVQDHWEANTFDVRDAVAELVQERAAEFVPGRLVQVIRR